MAEGLARVTFSIPPESTGEQAPNHSTSLMLPAVAPVGGKTVKPACQCLGGRAREEAGANEGKGRS